MITAITVLVCLAIVLSIALIITDRVCSTDGDIIANRVEACLPRIQCAQCGYAGCRPYAEAIAQDDAAINLCPPGGAHTVQRLADLLGRDAETVDNSLGQASLDQIALIDESVCIGCNLCARACPVDAIVGIHQMMHTIIMAHCTGCELCLPPCPVDCIKMVGRNA